MGEWLIRDRRGSDLVMHPSTQAALLLMRSLSEHYRFTRILDIGCGSGILTLAAAELWPEARLTAADIHPHAVKDAEANFEQGGLSERVNILRSDGYSHREIAGGAPYDLILSNLLAELHIRFSAQLRPLLHREGFAVLSGILAWQEAQVEAAYSPQGFEIAEQVAVEQWRALTLANSDI